MNKKLLLSIVFIVLVGFAGFVYAETSEGELNPTGIDGKITLKKGWNLVTVYAFSNLDIFDVRGNSNLIEELKDKGIRAIFFYDRYNKKYIQLYPQSSKKEADINAFLQHINFETTGDRGEYAAFTNSSMWVYSDKEQALQYHTTDGPFYLNYVNLKAGWNFLALTSEMYDKKLSDVKGSCVIEKAYGWDNSQGKGYWNDLLDEKLPPGAVGVGLIVKVSNDCKMGSAGVYIPPVPPLPDSSVNNSSDTQSGSYVIREDIKNLKFSESGVNSTSRCQLVNVSNRCTLYAAIYKDAQGAEFAAYVEVPDVPVTKEKFTQALLSGADVKPGDYMGNDYYMSIKGSSGRLLWFGGGKTIALFTDDLTAENGDYFEDLLVRYLPKYPSELKLPK